MSILSWRRLGCLSLKLARRSFDISFSASAFGLFITPRAIGFGSSSKGQVPGLFGSSLEESESLSEAWAELADELDAEAVEVD